MDIKKNEATATLRRVFFHLVDATAGLTPETAEAGEQPQISIAGAAWGNTTNVLVAIGNGRYYVELTQAETNQTPGTIIESRYKSANTAEALGSMVQITDLSADASVIELLDAALGDKVLDYTADTLTFLRRDGVSTQKVFDCAESSDDAKSYTEVTGQ